MSPGISPHLKPGLMLRSRSSSVQIQEVSRRLGYDVRVMGVCGGGGSGWGGVGWGGEALGV